MKLANKLLVGLKEFYDVFGIRGVYLGIVSLIIRRPKEFSVSHSSLAHPIYLRLKTSDRTMYKNIVVLNEYAFGLSEAPSVIVDAGANIGLTSIVFANRYPEAVIIAIEAERSNFDLLSKNVAPYANIHPVHAALWKSCTELSIVNEHANKCSFQVGKAKRGSDNKTQTVSAVTIDHVMTTFELDTIDLLKVDVEGAEIEIFGSCNSWIDRVSELIIELHDRHRTGCSESIEKLATDFPYKHTLGENIYLSRSGHFTFPNN